MRLLRVIGTLRKTAGGPVEALLQVTTALNQLGHQTEILTLDGNETPGLSDFPAIVHTLGPSIGKYGYNRKLVPWLLANNDRFDVIIVHGIWQYHSFAIWLAAKKRNFQYYVFVHGMLDPWFKYSSPLKHLKKQLYWPWAEYRVLRDAKAVLFTSEQEKELAAKSFWLYKANGKVVKYGTNVAPEDTDRQDNDFLDRFPALRNKRLILFLSRIHPKKGCDLLLQAFASVANIDANLHLVIAGPDEIGWKSDLEKLAERLGITNSITWTDMLTGSLKWGAYRESEVFILPSHSENFGIVIAESLACGLPVLITDKVNIWREIKEDGAGLVESDTFEGISLLLKKWLSLSFEERELMRDRAKKCFLSRFEINNVVQSFIDNIGGLK